MSPPDLARALAAFDLAIKTAGSLGKLAKICGCSKQNLSVMRRANRPLSRRYVNVVEAKLGVPRQLLIPQEEGHETVR